MTIPTIPFGSTGHLSTAAASSTRLQVDHVDMIQLL